MTAILSSYTNSMGSSSVTMCAGTLPLMWSMMAASVVVLPEPVGPVTRKSPCFLSDSSLSTSGRPSSSSVGTLAGMSRKATPGTPIWKNALPRNRATPGDREGEVQIPLGVQLGALVFVDHAVDQPTHILGPHRRLCGHGHQVATHAHHGRPSDLQMQIAAALLVQDLQELGHRHDLVFHGVPASGSSRPENESGRDDGDDPRDGRRGGDDGHRA